MTDYEERFSWQKTHILLKALITSLCQKLLLKVTNQYLMQQNTTTWLHAHLPTWQTPNLHRRSILPWCDLHQSRNWTSQSFCKWQLTSKEKNRDAERVSTMASCGWNCDFQVDIESFVRTIAATQEMLSRELWDSCWHILLDKTLTCDQFLKVSKHILRYFNKWQ